MIGELIIKYWVNFLLGIVATGLTIACKRFYKLWKEEKQHQKTTEQKAFYEGLENLIKQNAIISKEGDQKLQSQVDTLKAGILSLQSRAFQEDCHKLLKEEHEITIQEFEAIQKEHEVYNALGGNHSGDQIFAIVQQKASNQLSQA